MNPMNTEGKRVWKKLSKKNLIIGGRLTGTTLGTTAKEIINDLKDKLDDTYTLFDISVTINPNTFEPNVSIVLRKTEKG